MERNAMTELMPSADEGATTNALPRLAAPGIAVLLPPGWVVLHMDEGASDEVKSIVTHVMKTVVPDKRDLARARLISTALATGIHTAATTFIHVVAAIGAMNSLVLPAATLIPQVESAFEPSGWRWGDNW
ncbi:hypothetical protein I6E74_05865 [Salinibacterium sp. SWN139]|uniref:hypothetical protein n=1 Tax=Salinibacterium sp. SWN139 TaxID=2792055 RepID=UPI0018CD0C75|nr:hypothetical protein [Salinibacterium sp. SWN139]MBH0053697.1 hypothetical protein [Salinibacterium sp. SWN139]